MSFMGKILVVVQLVLSIFFMAFAGAVHSARTNWRNEATKQVGLLKKKSTEFDELQTEFSKFKDNSTAELNGEKAKAGKAEAENVGLKQQVDQLNKEKKDLTVTLSTQSQLAAIAGEEAKARRTESVELRAINAKLLAARDAGFREISKLEDTVQSLQTDLGTAQTKVKDLVGQVALFQKKLESMNISTDPKELFASVSVPPKVQGEVMATLPGKGQGKGELVEISLGSDDGLLKGHHLYIYRSGLKDGGKAKYLGKIRIVSTQPDVSVGLVLEETRGGIIQKGDNVTTKL